MPEVVAQVVERVVVWSCDVNNRAVLGGVLSSTGDVGWSVGRWWSVMVVGHGGLVHERQMPRWQCRDWFSFYIIFEENFYVTFRSFDKCRTCCISLTYYRL